MNDPRAGGAPRVDRRAFLGLLAGGAAASLAACQQQPTPTPSTGGSSGSAAPAAATGATSGPPGWEQQWNELIEAARREGKLILANPPFPKVRTDVTAAYQRKFGIEVEYVGVPTGQLMARLDGERAAGLYSIDVLMSGATSLYTQAMPNGYVDPLRPVLIHPEVLDASKWIPGRLWFMDPEQQYVLRYSTFLTLTACVNTQYYPASDFKSWRDLLDPRYRGKISAHDPGVAGTGWNTANYLLRQLGDDYIRSLYIDQQMGIGRTEHEIAEWMARGSYPISLGLTSTQIEPLRADGFPIAAILRETPEAPGVSGAGAGLGVLINRAPHPNAAKLFMNWAATREGNEVWNRALDYVSVRTDVDSSWAPDYVTPKPGVTYFDTYDWDYVMSTRSQEELEKLRRLVGR